MNADASLFDVLADQGARPIPTPAEARADRDRALAQVEENAPPDWIDEATGFVRAFLETHPTLFVDDLWNAGLPRPPQPKALGPVILRAARLGWMAKTGTFRPSASSHALPKPVWRSLIYRGDTDARP